MKKNLFLLMLYFLLNINPVFSQFIVTSSNPANGTANVPISTTISFTFSAPLDTSQRYGWVPIPTGWLQLPISIMRSPEDSLSINSVSYTSNLRTILFSITHTSNTDFTWLIIGAKSNSGVFLSKPYALNYSTSPTIGTRIVSGTISYPGGNPINSVVVLQDMPLFSDNENTKVSSIVTETSGAYIINYVRDGIYWPVAAKDFNGDGELDATDDVIGLYDPNSDGSPDSIVVSGGNVTNINMTLRLLFTPVNARTYLDTARIIAQRYAADQELRAVFAHGDTIGLNGSSVFWGYQFYSNSKRFATTVLASSIMFTSDTSDEGGYAPWLSNMKTIPLTFVDSNIPVNLAEANGGSVFRRDNNVISRILSGGNLFWAYPEDTTKLIWLVEYVAIRPDGRERIFRAFIDMLTGTFIKSVIVGVENESESVPTEFVLYQNYPNPFNPETRIQYSVASRQHVTLRVFDILGREVATLVDEVKEAGSYNSEFRIPHSALSSGVYFYELKSGTFINVKKMIYLK